MFRLFFNLWCIHVVQLRYWSLAVTLDVPLIYTKVQSYPVCLSDQFHVFGIGRFSFQNVLSALEPHMSNTSTVVLYFYEHF